MKTKTSRNDPYYYADKATELLSKKSTIRFRNALGAMHANDFDELNVIKTTDALFKALDKDNQSTFFELAELVYLRHNSEKKLVPKSKWLSDFLLEYDPVTRYVYENEIVRKRDRAKEAVVSAPDYPEKERELKKAEIYWDNMTAQYCDLVSDAAELKAYRDSGVKKVRWITKKDGRECTTCHKRNNVIYQIDRVPPKPHWGCRCRLEPVIETK